MKKPVFIISFDCEGKWGLADQITEYQCKTLTNENLNFAYRRVLEILDEYGFKATFAFVGGFMLSLDEFQANSSLFRDNEITGINWLSRFRRDLRLGNHDGWFNPTAFEMVRRNGKHEIASHGFTHVPLHEAYTSHEGFLHEMESISRLSKLFDVTFRTFVYPRNIVGYSRLLRNFGFSGYREGLSGTKDRRALILLRELNIKQSAQEHGVAENKLVKIPSGYFLNWRAHVRKLIPVSVTLRRWRHAINDAIGKERVIHLYAHPQDFVDGDRQYTLFERILGFVSSKRANDEILNPTQIQYCDMILNRGKGRK